MRAANHALRGWRAIAILFSLVGVSAAWPQSIDGATAAALDAALAGPQRSERNRARDVYRHPRETLDFFGLRRDMTVVEIWPASGWYTEILAPVLKGHGRLYAAQYGSHSPIGYQKEEDAGLRERAKREPEVFGEVNFTALFSPMDLSIAPAGSADLVLTFRNVHNWVNPQYRQDPGKIFRAIHAALKPGGILGVVDHRWPDPKTEDPAAKSGYVSQERVMQLAKAAGFEFVGSSDVNRNPRDTHEHPNGVWSLLPDLSVPAANREQYRAIGESDRLTLKFRKPLK